MEGVVGHEFVVGDIVTLRSGGPFMTVQSVYEGEVTCVWFDGGIVRNWTFPESLLVCLPEK
jgi:uncharacterized protein YodC (DUF2158 family)